jgi:molecular chaperone GrpE (heat shock protein)
MKKTQKTHTPDNPKEDLVDELKQEVIDLDSKWKRALADYQNLEKRTLTDRQTFVKLANLSLVSSLLPVLDDLERASTPSSGSRFGDGDKTIPSGAQTRRGGRN